MAQLVHGIAPGARILFADQGMSERDTATNIEKLAQAGADIIVDDIGFLSEPFFQQGVISAMYEKVRAEYSVAAFTSAGNAGATGKTGTSAGRPIAGWQTRQYRAMECPDWLVSGSPTAPNGSPDALFGTTGFDCLDFDPGPDQLAYDTLEIVTDSSLPDALVLTPTGFAGEPMFGATSEFEWRFYLDEPGASPQLIAAATQVGPTQPGFFGALVVEQGSTVRMVLVRTAVQGVPPATAPPEALADPPAIWLGFYDGARAIASRTFLGNAELGDAATDWVGASVYGHTGGGSATSVAALAWDRPTQVREYSALGPGTLLFAPVSLDGSQTPSPRLAQPVTPKTPHVATVDGTRTSFFGKESTEAGETVFRFTGTSASAPNAAAVAALAIEYSRRVAAPGAAVSGDQLTNLLVRTARGPAEGGPINPYATSHYPDTAVFGTGIIDAMRLFGALTPTTPPSPSNPDPSPGTGGGGGSTVPPPGVGGGSTTPASGSLHSTSATGLAPDDQISAERRGTEQPSDRPSNDDSLISANETSRSGASLVLWVVGVSVATLLIIAGALGWWRIVLLRRT